MLYCNDSHLKKLVFELSEKSENEAKIYPIDRAFLEPYLTRIRLFNETTFLFCNLELMDSLYVNQLFVCLPEVWEDVTVDDLKEFIESFTHITPYYSLLKFTYKYLEIDIIDLILNSGKISTSPKFEIEIIAYLKSQWNVLIKSSGDLEDFSNGFIDVDYSSWIYIKQKLLIDNRIKPAVLDLYEMKKYIKNKFP